MSQGELFKDEVLRTADAVTDLERRLVRLTEEVRELGKEVAALHGWRGKLERRQDVLAEGVASVAGLGRHGNLMVVK